MTCVNVSRYSRSESSFSDINEISSRFFGGNSLQTQRLGPNSSSRCWMDGGLPSIPGRRINGALALFEALATSKEGSNLVGRRAVLTLMSLDEPSLFGDGG